MVTRRLLLALLVVAWLVPAPAAATDSTALRAWMTEARAWSVNATGFRGRVQARPYAHTNLTATWVGGWLADHTFVQMGLGMASDGMPTTEAFGWSVPPDGSFTGPSIRWYDGGYQIGQWVDFVATLENGVWTMRTGSVILWTMANPNPLTIFSATHENWMAAWGPIPTGAMRDVRIRVGGKWIVPPHLTYGASTDAQCGTEQIKATPGPNLVFRSAVTGHRCRAVLT